MRVVCALLVLGWTPLLAQEAPEALRYRWGRLAGKTAVYTVETELRQSVVHGSAPPAEGLRWRRDSIEQRFQVRGGAGRVRQLTHRIELRVEQPGEQPVRWDSDGEEEAPDGLDKSGLERLHRTVLLSVDPRGRVTRVRGAAGPAQKVAYKASFLVLPEDAISVGASWRKTPPQEVPYPPFGSLTYHTSYRLQSHAPATSDGPGQRVISAETKILFAPDPPEEGQEAPVVEVVRQEAGGTLTFDDNGLLLESQFRSVLELKITAEGVTRTERAESTTVQRLRDLAKTKK